MEIATVFQKLGIALGLGLLIGLQRERSANDLAGVRTFPLVTLLGGVCALLAQTYGGWVLAAGLISMAAMVVIGNLAKFKEGQLDPGLTTEVAILLMFVVGAYLMMGYAAIAIAIGGGAAVLLHFKGQLHGIAQRLGDDDLKAIMQFALLSLVILPVLPNATYGPYAVLNPQHIWWMVVLIVGISLTAYIVYKFFGASVSGAIGGIVGGAISSTATTASYSRLSAGAPERTTLALSVIMTAATVVLVRVFVEVAVVAPSFLPAAAPPLLMIFAVSLALSGASWLWSLRAEIGSDVRGALCSDHSGDSGGKRTLRQQGALCRGSPVGYDGHGCDHSLGVSPGRRGQAGCRERLEADRRRPDVESGL
jgi:uncharacterized membrane protein (DUF4010 family)